MALEVCFSEAGKIWALQFKWRKDRRERGALDRAADTWGIQLSAGGKRITESGGRVRKAA